MIRDKRYLFLAFLAFAPSMVVAQQNDTIKRLDEVTVGARRNEGVTRMSGALNGQQLGQDELFRAACCNLGESFVNNPSVDVNYNDAAVGARQIKLLGLSGQYVQMLVEGLSVAGGALLPYTLDYVPGAWMRSISVSKGTSSVKQGYQSITGQIDVEYLKPDEDQGLLVNLYGSSLARAEGNMVGNIHINKYLSTELVGHWEHDYMHHDADGDGWHDMPAIHQIHLQNRWKYRRGRYVMHAGVGYLTNERLGGQMMEVLSHVVADSLYQAQVRVDKLEGYMKHAWLLNREHNTNIAFTSTAGAYSLDGIFGMANTHFDQGIFTSQLMLEHDFTEAHTISTGLSINADRYNDGNAYYLREVVPGAYAQYTFKPSYRFTLMAGLRTDLFDADHDPAHGDDGAGFGDYHPLRTQWFVTPRLHVKWVAADWVTLRASAGKGYRPVHPMAELHYMRASGRTLNIPHTLMPEEAWNSGVSAVFYIPAGGNSVTVNAEYYYTDFLHQAVVDYDSDPLAISVYDLSGRSFSHTLQIDANYPVADELDATVAFRYNKVQCTYGNKLLDKPLQSRYKGLITLGWKPMMGLWQVDVTLQLNGPGRMPEPYTQADGNLSWEREFPAYLQLNMQVTREFRHLSFYVGGENLTNYRQSHPVIGADNPWAATFEPTMIWGPVMGIMAYAGIRMNFWRIQ